MSRASRPKTSRRPPLDCPSCGERMSVAAMACGCGTGVTGRFDACEFCALSERHREVLRVFLESRGNTRDLERHLGVSYPTARARLEEVLVELGYPRPGGKESAEKLEVLRAVASGDMTVDEALPQLE